MQVGVYTFQVLAHPYDHPETQRFFAETDALLDTIGVAPGFVRAVRVPAEAAPYPKVAAPAGQPKYTLTFWADLAAAFAYSYRLPEHAPAMRRLRGQVRRDPPYPNHVIFWLAEGRVAGESDDALLAEAISRYQALAERGPTAAAFEFKVLFEADGTPIDFLAFRR